MIANPDAIPHKYIGTDSLGNKLIAIERISFTKEGKNAKGQPEYKTYSQFPLRCFYTTTGSGSQGITIENLLFIGFNEDDNRI